MLAAISWYPGGAGAQDLGPLTLPQAVVVVLMLIKTAADILIASYVSRAGKHDAVHVSQG